MVLLSILGSIEASGKGSTSLPWMFWSWCFAHRLELASKSGLTSQLFKVNGRNDAALVLLVQEISKEDPRIDVDC